MFSDKAVIESSEKYVRLILRRPHAYWFKRKYPKAPIPGFAFLSPEGEVIDTFPLLRPGQTLEKFRVAIEQNGKSATRKISPQAGLKKTAAFTAR